MGWQVSNQIGTLTCRVWTKNTQYSFCSIGRVFQMLFLANWSDGTQIVLRKMIDKTWHIKINII